MARPKKPALAAPPAPQPEDEREEIVVPDSIAELETEGKLAFFHDKFGEKDYKVRIEVFHREDNEWEMVDTVKLDGFDPFNSLKKYGGGRYRLSLLDDGGCYVKGGRMEVRIAQAAVSAQAASPSNQPDASMSLLIETLKAQNAQSLEIIKASLGRPIPEQKGPSLTELISALSGLKGLTPKEDGGMGGIEKTLGLMKLVKELMPEPAESSGEGVMGEIAQAVKVASEMGLLNRGQRGPAPAPRQAPPPQNLAAGTVVLNPEPPTPIEEPESPMRPVIDKLKSYVPTFISWAKRDKPVEDAADFLIDELDNEIVPLIVKHYKPGGVITLTREVVWGDLLSKAKDPNQVIAIFSAVPELGAYRSWVERVIAEAVKVAEAPAEEETEDAPADA